MVRKTITRTLVTTTIRAVALNVVDGSPVVENLEPVTVVGKPNTNEAIKAVREVYGKEKNVSIMGMDSESAVYEISVSDFLKLAKRTENQTEEKEIEE